MRYTRKINNPGILVGNTISNFDWSGQDVRVEFRPAGANEGVYFVRGDLDPAVRIPATVAHRVETPRRTTLSLAGTRVEMIEHVMAALAGLEIDNCEILVDQPEMPGLDGSSQAFVTALSEAGVQELDAPPKELVVREITRLGDDEAWIEARPAKAGLSIKYRLDYGSANAIGRQTLDRVM